MNGQDQPIEIMLSRYCKGKMPKDASDDEWRAFHRSFELFKTTARGLAIEIYKGYAFCPIFDGRRIKPNFGEAYHIAVDFDSGDQRSSIDNLSQIDIVRDYASFIYTTPSHTEEHPKARVVWIFEDSIMSLSFFETLFKALLWSMPFADQGVKDGLRLYYGAPGCTVRGNWKLFTHDAIHSLTETYQAHNPKKVEVERKIRVAPETVALSYLERKRELILAKLAGAKDGEKHKTVFNMALLLGGLAAAGYYSLAEVQEDLKRVVDSELSNVANYESAYQTIEDGLEMGALKPVYIDRAYNPGDQRHD